MGITGARSSSRSTSRRAPDANLVGLRYEKTVQAEPPIPLPPRNPPRMPVRSTAASILSLSPSPTPSSPSSSSLCHAHSPVVVVVVAPPQPQAPLPIVAPPTEQHPALRTPVLQTRFVHDGWKRDSGLAPTPTSSVTIREEACEDSDGDSNRDSAAEDPTPWPARIDELIRVGVVPPPPPPPPVRHGEHRTAHGPARAAFTPSCLTRPETMPPAAASAVASAAAAESTCPPQLSRHHSLPPPPSSSLSLSQRRRNLLKRFSVRSSASANRGKSTLLIGEASTAAAPTMQPIPTAQPLVRGPPPPHPASANKQPHQQSPRPQQISSLETASLQSSTTSPDASSVADRDLQFSPLGIAIPTDSLIEDEFMATLSFSNRGSIMFGGQRAAVLGLDGAHDTDNSATLAAPASLRSAQASTASVDQLSSHDDAAAAAADTVPRVPLPPPDILVLTAEVEKESQKVRSLYGVGDTINWEDGARRSLCEPLEPTLEVPAEEDGNDSAQQARLAPAWATPRSAASFSPQPDGQRRQTELAGGIEDWEDVDGANVDRYGFITAPRSSPRLSTPTDMRAPQFSPRRRNVLSKWDNKSFSSPLSIRHAPSRKVSARSLNTQNSGVSTASKRSSRSVIRQASNLLPHNRDRRWMDEAGDMLTLSPNLQGAAEEAEVERISETLKRKEWERSEKWRKMAKVVQRGGQGQGMAFEFDMKNPKLIDRTWKGIPDRWRAAAWWSFLASSAKDRDDLDTEEEILAAFHRLLERASPDDVQIDLDVPRTISQHIMFRKRYRGGQRLLFRVLHALSIYFPTTGYVQGMASLAATLLCYFDEEKCFVMLVRMWQLRGLDRLYRPGFEGLLMALREFNDVWLNKDVARKLSELGIDITAYGTRWYLTLFNLSIPFPAQLRVWDIFLLLGDVPFDANPPNAQGTGSTTGLDVLHATSAALIQALREMLLDSDFENAMKGLTSWIPIKDEDLLMKVTKAEWKSHQGKKKT